MVWEIGRWFDRVRSDAPAATCHPSTSPDTPRSSRAADRRLPDGVEGRQRLSYSKAAAEFVSWLQGIGETGEISRRRLQSLYGEHCELRDYAELPSNHFFCALARIATRWERRVPRRDGRRQRETTYDIPRQATVGETIPIQRRAAA